jgi:hypothetical protein
MKQINKIYWADKLGAISAFLCIVHCLAVPTLLAMGMGFLSNPIVALLFIAIAFISIYKTTNGKFNSKITAFLWVSFAGFIVSILLEEQSVFFEYSMFLFSAFIIFGHLYNMRNCFKL